MSVYFVHCNVCQRMPDKHVQFFVGECGHIACSTCVEDVPSRMQPKCEVCNRKIRLQLIGPEMRGKEFFMNPVPLLDGIINKLYDRALVLPPLESGSHQGDAPQLSLTDASTAGVKPHVVHKPPPPIRKPPPPVEKPRVRSQQTSFAQPRSLLQKSLGTERHKTPEKANTTRIQQPSFVQPRSVQLKSPNVKGILRKSQTLNPPPVVITPHTKKYPSVTQLIAEARSPLLARRQPPPSARQPRSVDLTRSVVHFPVPVANSTPNVHSWGSSRRSLPTSRQYVTMPELRHSSARSKK